MSRRAMRSSGKAVREQHRLRELVIASDEIRRREGITTEVEFNRRAFQMRYERLAREGDLSSDGQLLVRCDVGIMGATEEEATERYMMLKAERARKEIGDRPMMLCDLEQQSQRPKKMAPA